ncbi:GM16557 [Drosophila sechellia]|uniref:GM16557 n=1 Tax=Drosophila sechellia TaxID=7238 RepID=B4IMZ2_DROSE|nr:GM16557 [Drosophila sechellia]
MALRLIRVFRTISSDAAHALSGESGLPRLKSKSRSEEPGKPGGKSRNEVVGRAVRRGEAPAGVTRWGTSKPERPAAMMADKFVWEAAHEIIVTMMKRVRMDEMANRIVG